MGMKRPRQSLGGKPSPQQQQQQRSPIFLVFSHIVVALVCVQIGLVIGSRACASSTMAGENGGDGHSNGINSPLSVVDCAKSCPASKASRYASDDSAEIFPKSIQGFLRHASVVNRNDFIEKFDLGVPWDESSRTNQQVLLLYNHGKSVPNATAKRHTSSNIPEYSVDAAVENCHTVKVVLQRTAQENVCFAMVGQWDSHHVHKYMRIPEARKRAASLDLPLRYVSRLQQPNGRLPDSIATDSERSQYHDMLRQYLEQLPSTLAQLRPIAQAAATDDRTIVVLVVNEGQSELLQNFGCASRARGLDLSNVLVFCADPLTCQIADAIGLHNFNLDQGRVFGFAIPPGAARRYGDATFTALMFSKVYVVHTLSMLGYNVLFQDADIVWYRNPLEYFRPDTNPDLGDYDVYFQDDGAHSVRYAPYSPNTGFYYVRHNERTTAFIDLFARSGDMIQASGSHQSALNAVLAEQASIRGLRVKVYGRDSSEGMLFPGGYHFHRRKAFVKEMVQDKISEDKRPYLFHMSWTTNKVNKVKFFQQLGDWYLQNQCIAKPNHRRHHHQEEEAFAYTNADWATACCSVEPMITCHYRDKPSKIPCPDSPMIDGPRSRSFW